MKILACGDIHGDGQLAKKLAEKAKKENVDTVVIAGDFSNGEDLSGVFTAFEGLKILFVGGNHDEKSIVDVVKKIYGAEDLHAAGKQISNIGFFGCGGANIGLNAINDKKITNYLEKGFYYVQNTNKKIMITHVHPTNSLLEKFSKLVPASKGVEEAIKKLQPDIAICSHVHEANGIEDKIGKTKLFCAGRDGVILDL